MIDDCPLTTAPQTLALWAFRYRLVEYLPDHIAARFRDYAPVGTFEAAMEGGFQSSTFDLSANLEDDQRQGLDEVRNILSTKHQLLLSLPAIPPSILLGTIVALSASLQAGLTQVRRIMDM